jgi:hypothetical protein
VLCWQNRISQCLTKFAFNFDFNGQGEASILPRRQNGGLLLVQLDF